MKIDIAGVQVDAITKAETLEAINKFLQDGKKHYLVTTYSEQIVFAQSDKIYRDVLNQADLCLPDGIGILWAAKFLESREQGRVKIFFQFIASLFGIILNPKSIRQIIPEQVTGRLLIYDLVKLAQEKKYSVALVGGWNNVANDAAETLKKLCPNLRINLAVSPPAFDQKTVEQIAASNSDILLLAYSPPKQEKWIEENLSNLNVKLAIGLGGTFDYLAKRAPSAPNFVHYMGLEWLWRLITQPWRIKRMWNAIVVFSFIILKYKLSSNGKYI